MRGIEGSRKGEVRGKDKKNLPNSRRHCQYNCKPIIIPTPTDYCPLIKTNYQYQYQYHKITLH